MRSAFSRRSKKSSPGRIDPAPVFPAVFPQPEYQLAKFVEQFPQMMRYGQIVIHGHAPHDSALFQSVQQLLHNSVLIFLFHPAIQGQGHTGILTKSRSGAVFRAQSVFIRIIGQSVYSLRARPGFHSGIGEISHHGITPLSAALLHTNHIRLPYMFRPVRNKGQGKFRSPEQLPVTQRKTSPCFLYEGQLFQLCTAYGLPECRSCGNSGPASRKRTRSVPLHGKSHHDSAELQGAS